MKINKHLVLFNQLQIEKQKKSYLRLLRHKKDDKS